LAYTYTIINNTPNHVYFELSTVGAVFAKGTIGPKSSQPMDIPGVCLQSANARAVEAPNTTTPTTLPAAADPASYGSGFECKNKSIHIDLPGNKLVLSITD